MHILKNSKSFNWLYSGCHTILDNGKRLHIFIFSNDYLKLYWIPSKRTLLCISWVQLAVKQTQEKWLTFSISCLRLFCCSRNAICRLCNKSIELISVFSHGLIRNKGKIWLSSHSAITLTLLELKCLIHWLLSEISSQCLENGTQRCSEK